MSHERSRVRPFTDAESVEIDRRIAEAIRRTVGQEKGDLIAQAGVNRREDRRDCADIRSHAHRLRMARLARIAATAALAGLAFAVAPTDRR